MHIFSLKHIQTFVLGYGPAFQASASFVESFIYLPHRNIEGVVSKTSLLHDLASEVLHLLLAYKPGTEVDGGLDDLWFMDKGAFAKVSRLANDLLLLNAAFDPLLAELC